MESEAEVRVRSQVRGNGRQRLKGKQSEGEVKEPEAWPSWSVARLPAYVLVLPPVLS